MRRRRASGQSGQALVEFTLVAALLVVLLLAIIQFGVLYSTYITTTDAAREGARRAVVSRAEGQSGMVAAATAAARDSAASLDQGRLQVAVTAPSGSWGEGEPITVTVQYPYAVSVLGWAVKSGSLSSSTTMRVE